MHVYCLGISLGASTIQECLLMGFVQFFKAKSMSFRSLYVEILCGHVWSVPVQNDILMTEQLKLEFILLE